MVVPIKLTAPKSIEYDISIDAIPELKFDTRIAVVTNTTVAPLHLQALLDKIDAPYTETIILPDGEEHKTLASIELILDKLFNAKFDRGSILIALGGGVIGDMTGFAASIYQRGIPFIQIPTTLLSQVDASVGGKTGVNSSYGKNLIGSFWQPKAVYIDINFLHTLPDREFSAGIAEVVKMAVMFDKNFFKYLQNHCLKETEVIKEMIRISVQLKANIVNQDEKEQGVRAVLNYGHTFAHVIEKETAYKQYLHGEAVSIGMVMANSLACKMGLLQEEDAKQIKNLLEQNNLPVDYEIKNVDEFHSNFALDKKSSNGKAKFILTDGNIGTHMILSDIDENMLRDVLHQFGVK